MTRTGKYIFIFITFLILSAHAYSQQSRSSAATLKNEQVKEANKKAYQKARKKTIKHRRDIQTKETRKRMDESDRRADAYNRKNDRKWYTDIFKKKKAKR